jgi:hypothetical protein
MLQTLHLHASMHQAQWQLSMFLDSMPGTRTLTVF